MSLESLIIFAFKDEEKIVNFCLIPEKIIIKFGRAKTAKSVREQNSIQYYFHTTTQPNCTTIPDNILQCIL